MAVVEWTDPMFSAGHWVPDMVEAAGGLSVLGVSGQRSEMIGPERLAESDADVVVVAPCGYNLAGASELAAVFVEQTQLPSGAAVWAVDADAAFVRPGPRIVDGIEALAGICHPQVLTPRPDLAAVVRDASQTRTRM